MTNKEKFGKQILDILAAGDTFGVVDNQVLPCADIDCDKCEIRNFEKGAVCFCSTGRGIWLNEESEELPELTKFQVQVIELLFEQGFCFVARGDNDELYVYECEPYFDSFIGFWLTDSGKVLPAQILSPVFDFVKIEAEKPTDLRRLIAKINTENQ